MDCGMRPDRMDLEEVLRRPADPARGPLTILLVDDDQDCRTFVRDAIRESGSDHRVIECDNGYAALHYLQHSDVDSRPGLIFLDVEMPGMNGLETLARIRSCSDWNDIPVVMLTGVADEEHMRRAAALGANSYTVKPARAEQFLTAVLASTNYWLTVHQYPQRHLPQDQARR
jgi:CheY-like chemotaxis protein